MECAAVIVGVDESLKSGVGMARVVTEGVCRTFNGIRDECGCSTEISRDLGANHVVKATISRLKN